MARIGSSSAVSDAQTAERSAFARSGPEAGHRLTGLASSVAAERLAAYGPNEMPTEKKRNLRQQAWEVVREPMILLAIAAGMIGVTWFDVYKLVHSMREQ